MTRTREENALDMAQDELDKLRAELEFTDEDMQAVEDVVHVEPVELDLFWFPWCTSHYVDSYCDEKMQELEDSGEYWGVRSVGGRIEVKMAHNPDAWKDGKLVESTLIDRKEAIEKGLVKEV